MYSTRESKPAFEDASSASSYLATGLRCSKPSDEDVHLLVRKGERGSFQPQAVVKGITTSS